MFFQKQCRRLPDQSVILVINEVPIPAVLLVIFKVYRFCTLTVFSDRHHSHVFATIRRQPVATCTHLLNIISTLSLLTPLSVVLWCANCLLPFAVQLRIQCKSPFHTICSSLTAFMSAARNEQLHVHHQRTGKLCNITGPTVRASNQQLTEEQNSFVLCH